MAMRSVYVLIVLVLAGCLSPALQPKAEPKAGPKTEPKPRPKTDDELTDKEMYDTDWWKNCLDLYMWIEDKEIDNSEILTDAIGAANMEGWHVCNSDGVEASWAKMYLKLNKKGEWRLRVYYHGLRAVAVIKDVPEDRLKTFRLLFRQAAEVFTWRRKSK